MRRSQVAGGCGAAGQEPHGDSSRERQSLPKLVSRCAREQVQARRFALQLGQRLRGYFGNRRVSVKCKVRRLLGQLDGCLI